MRKIAGTFFRSAAGGRERRVYRERPGSGVLQTGPKRAWATGSSVRKSNVRESNAGAAT